MVVSLRDRIVIANLGGYGNRRWRFRISDQDLSRERGKVENYQPGKFGGLKTAGYFVVLESHVQSFLLSLTEIREIRYLRMTHSYLEVEVEHLQDWVGVEGILIRLMTKFFGLVEPVVKFEDQNHTVG